MGHNQKQNNEKNEAKKQHVLLAVSGMTPQIITETLYGIYQQDPTKLPQRIEVITTEIGHNILNNTFFGEHSPLQKLIDDYQLPNITFRPEDIKVPCDDDGKPLYDVQSEREQEIITDYITQHVRKLSLDQNTVIHASLAGGRKTMGFAMGYAMSLFGRPHDCLSHVLVSESCGKDFYYPIPTADQKDSSAQVILAKIPLVLMREEMPTSLIENDGLSYTQTVERINRANALNNDTAQVELDFSNMSIWCDGTEIQLKGSNFAFYCWLAQETKHSRQGVCAPNQDMSIKTLDERFAQYLVSLFPDSYQKTHSQPLDVIYKKATNYVRDVVAQEKERNKEKKGYKARSPWILMDRDKNEKFYDINSREKNDNLLTKHKNLWARLLDETNKAIENALGPRRAIYYTIQTIDKIKTIEDEFIEEGEDDVVRSFYEYKGLQLNPENIIIK
ncbi:CRISPR-associated ring nuclease Csm6 [Edwardsiella tarda]|uniref:CRISPR-associated ring nuclease Csm6 n=1 Tax=Edwardsiella tarda TaxID=636 RepID=UPI00351CA00F